MSIGSSSLREPQYIETELTYLTPMAEKLLFDYTKELLPGLPRADGKPGVPLSNGKYETHKLSIHNARAIAQNLSLDGQGFELIAHHSNVSNFYDKDNIRQVYYPEAEELLKEVTGATQVVAFDFTLRNSQRLQLDEIEMCNAQQLQLDEIEINEPLKYVHNDFTAKSGYTRARVELAARGINNIDELLQQRFAIINIWRPIAPVQELPLALCDAQSIASADLVLGELRYRDRGGEVYAITYNETHKWFYFPQMQPDEAVFFKCFDSAEDGRARFVAHAGFDDPTSPPDAPARESIELRTLVFYPT